MVLKSEAGRASVTLSNDVGHVHPDKVTIPQIGPEMDQQDKGDLNNVVLLVLRKNSQQDAEKATNSEETHNVVDEYAEKATIFKETHDVVDEDAEKATNTNDVFVCVKNNG